MKGMGLRHTEHELGTCVCCTNVCTAPVVDGVVEGGRIGRRGVEGGEPSSTKRVTHLHAIRPLGTPFLKVSYFIKKRGWHFFEGELFY